MIVLVGYAVYILASLAIGIRLLKLWGQTREWPEFTLGIAFLLGGAGSHVAWLAVAISLLKGAPVETVKVIATVGLIASSLGGLSIGWGIALIFRPRALWAKLFLGAVALGMATGTFVYVAHADFGTSMVLWWTLCVSLPIYCWAAVETLSLGRVLAKRAKLGMAEPIVVNRTRMWGYSNLTVVVTIAVSVTARIVYGPEAPAWTALLSSMSLMVGAGAIWLGFFPPEVYRARLRRVFGEA